MRSGFNLLVKWFMCVLLAAALMPAASAESKPDRTQVGHDISVGPDEEVSEVTCFGCSVRIRGHVSGDATTFGGSIVVDDHGEVGGDATTFGGDIRLNKEVSVHGDVTVFGGRIRRDPAAVIGGDVTNMGGPGWIVLIFALPLAFVGLFVALVIWLIMRLLRPATPPAPA